MNPSTANNLLLSTDFPLDKIIYMNSGSISVPSGSSLDINVPHNLPFRPLLIATWSTTADFAISYEQGVSGFTDLSIPQLSVQSTPTDIRFLPLNYTGSTLTYYWRVFGFMPSDVDAEAIFTSATADSFVLNTDYNYTKLWDSGIKLWASGTQTIDHNFGYRPQIEIWFEQELNSNLLTRWFQGIDTSYGGTDKVLVTDNQIIFYFNSSGGVTGRKWYYRIYTDRAVQ